MIILYHISYYLVFRSDVDLCRSFNCPHCGNLATSPYLMGDGTKFACSSKSFRDKPKCQRDNCRLVNAGITVDNRTYITHDGTWKTLMHFCGASVYSFLY